LDAKGVEPEGPGSIPESGKSALKGVANAPLPLEFGGVAIGEDGHIERTHQDRPLSFRFSACGVVFEAEIAGRTAPLRLRADLGKLPYTAESPEARSLARIVLGASGRLRRGHILLTPEHDMVLEGELTPPSPRTPASVIATAVALVLDFQPYLDLLGEAVALRRGVRPAAEACADAPASPSPSSA
jgi:hypothetical protein